MTGSRRYLSVVLAGLVVVLALEIGSRCLMYLLRDDSGLDFRSVAARLREQSARLKSLLEEKPGRRLQLDAELGWIYAPQVGQNKDNHATYSQGVRATRAYDRRRKPETFRIAAFGGSFVYASEVSDEETWSAQLEALDDRIEVLNYGIGGYGTDQALLLYDRRGTEFDPDLVLLGVVELDLARIVNRYTGFRIRGALGKPRFRITSGGELELIPNPFPGAEGARRLLDDPWAILEAAPDDWFFDPLVWRNPLFDRLATVRLVSTAASKLWRTRLRANRLYRGGALNVNSEAFDLFMALIHRFDKQVTQSGRQFLVVVFTGKHSDVWGDAPPAYAPLIESLRETWVLDLGPELARDAILNPHDLLAPGGHLSAAGNASVARVLHREFERRRLLHEPGTASVQPLTPHWTYPSARSPSSSPGGNCTRSLLESAMRSRSSALLSRPIRARGRRNAQRLQMTSSECR